MPPTIASQRTLPASPAPNPGVMAAKTMFGKWGQAQFFRTLRSDCVRDARKN